MQSISPRSATGGHLQGQQATGTGPHAAGAADARRNCTPLRLLRGQGQQAVAALDRRHPRAREGLSHHGTPADQPGGLDLESAAVIDQVLQRRAQGDPSIAGSADGPTADRHDARHQWAAVTQGLVHRKGRGRVVDHHAHVGGQSARRGFTADQGLHQVLLRAHGIAGRQTDDPDPVVGSCRLLHHGRLRVRLIVLDADEDAGDAQGVGHDPHLIDHRCGLFTHQAVVAGEIGLTLRAVDDQGMQPITLTQAELYRGREGRAAHADDTGGGDPAGDLLRCQGKGIGDPLDGVGPAVLAIRLQRDGAYIEPRGVVRRKLPIPTMRPEVGACTGADSRPWLWA